MDGVRLLARVFGWTGWVTMILGGLGLLGMASQLGSTFGGRGGGGLVALATVAGGAIPLLAMALGPFFLWALLTSLCEIHSQNERMQESLEDLRRASDVRAGAIR